MTNVANWVSQETTTTGAGAITLGNSITGFSTWVQAFGSGTTNVWYAIESGDDKEVGIGSFDGTAGTLTRTDVRATLVSGVYDDTSPSPLNLTGTSIVSNTFNASAYSSIWTDVVISTYAGFPAPNEVPASIGGTTTIDFSSGNVQRVTGTGTTTLGDWTFPTPGRYEIIILDTLIIFGVTAVNSKEMGSQAYGFEAGKDHLVMISWDGTTARWSGIPEV